MVDLVPAAERFNVESDRNPERELLRHALATVAYRGGKAVRDAPETFGTFKAGASRNGTTPSSPSGTARSAVSSRRSGDLTRTSRPTRRWRVPPRRFFRAL